MSWRWRCVSLRPQPRTLEKLDCHSTPHHSTPHHCRRSAEQAFKRSIEAEPSYSDAWNGLGAVSRDPLVQQHCWVRAVQLAHNPSAWANLGMLYLRWGLDIQVGQKWSGLRPRLTWDAFRLLGGFCYRFRSVKGKESRVTSSDQPGDASRSFAVAAH